MGSMIGKGGSRFREIEEASAAKLRAEEYILPQSTDRVLIVNGVADALHIALYYICTTYISHREYLTTKPIFYNPLSRMQYQHPQSHYAGVRSRGSRTLQAQPYNTHSSRNPQSIHLGGGIPPPGPDLTSNPSLSRAHETARAAPRGQRLNQDVYIPNSFVGYVIGKGGARIKEIRNMSRSSVTVTNPTPDSEERLIQIAGLPESNQLAIHMIHSVIENEKARNGASAITGIESTASGLVPASSRFENIGIQSSAAPPPY